MEPAVTIQVSMCRSVSQTTVFICVGRCWDDLDSGYWWIIKIPILLSVFVCKSLLETDYVFIDVFIVDVFVRSFVHSFIH